MLSSTHKRILQGSTMHLIDEQNFKHVLEAINLKNHFTGGYQIPSLQVNLNRPYLERLDLFIKDLSLGERNLFVATPPTELFSGHAYEKRVAFPLAKKAWVYVCESFENSCEWKAVLEHRNQQLKERLPLPMTLLTFPTLDALEIPSFNCFYSGSQENLEAADNIEKEKYHENTNAIDPDFLPIWDDLGPCITEGNVGPGLGREVLEQENHHNPSPIENGA